MADDGLYYFDKYSENDTLSQQETEDREKFEVVNKRASELLLDSGVLEPLKNLASVKIFAFDFALVGSMPKYEAFEPQQKHIDIIKDLKAAVEHNWAVGQIYF